MPDFYDFICVFGVAETKHLKLDEADELRQDDILA